MNYQSLMFTPTLDAYSRECYVVPEIGRTRSGFQFRFQSIDRPIFLPGELVDWNFLSLDSGTQLVAFSYSTGVIQIRVEDLRCIAWLVPFYDINVVGDSVEFVSEGHPIDGFCPPMFHLNLRNSQAKYCLGGNKKGSCDWKEPTTKFLAEA